MTTRHQTEDRAAVKAIIARVERHIVSALERASGLTIRNVQGDPYITSDGLTFRRAQYSEDRLRKIAKFVLADPDSSEANQAAARIGLRLSEFWTAVRTNRPTWGITAGLASAAAIAPSRGAMTLINAVKAFGPRATPSIKAAMIQIRRDHPKARWKEAIRFLVNDKYGKAIAAREDATRIYWKDAKGREISAPISSFASRWSRTKARS